MLGDILCLFLRKDILNITFEFFSPPRLRSDGHIAQVFMPLFMLHYFSMSWNAMFLVLLTLYSVIHFIINSLPNIFASVLIADTLSDILRGIRDNKKHFLQDAI